MGLLNLFKPAWQSKNYNKAKAAIDKISDQKMLTKIVLTDGVNLYIKQHIISVITDLSLLIQIL